MRGLHGRGRAGAAAFALGIMLALAGCGVPGMVPAGHALPTAAPTATATPLPPVRLPQDEAPHTDLTEWWYYTGHLHGTDAGGQTHTYGFELTFFQVLRGNLAPDYIGHVAMTDLTRGTFQFDQRLVAEPGAPLPNGTTTTGFDLHIGDWAMRGVNGQDHLAAALANYAFQLDLTATKPPALHAGNGLITYGLAGFSYYYSRTRMTVGGTLLDHGATIAVSGLAWMDHQWGNFIPTVGGWDWFSVQLTNDTEYMVYLIRDATGKVISVVGTQVDAQGQASAVPSSAIQETVRDHWTSPQTGITYPSGWTLTLPGGSLTITPLLKNQELLTTATTGNTYWEGACAISGQINGQAVNGEGYTELTGYQAGK